MRGCISSLCYLCTELQLQYVNLRGSATWHSRSFLSLSRNCPKYTGRIWTSRRHVENATIRTATWRCSVGAICCTPSKRQTEQFNDSARISLVREADGHASDYAANLLEDFNCNGILVSSPPHEAKATPEGKVTPLMSLIIISTGALN